MNCPICGYVVFELHVLEERLVELDTEAHLVGSLSVRITDEGPNGLRSAHCLGCGHDCTALFETAYQPSRELRTRAPKVERDMQKSL